MCEFFALRQVTHTITRPGHGPGSREETENEAERGGGGEEGERKYVCKRERGTERETETGRPGESTRWRSASHSRMMATTATMVEVSRLVLPPPSSHSASEAIKHAHDPYEQEHRVTTTGFPQWSIVSA